MRRFLYGFAFIAIVSACSTGVNKDLAQTESNNMETVIVPNRLLTMEIDGMVCEMGSGESIRKALNKLEGVSSVEFDFEDERATNRAKISFDKNQISVDEMVKAITDIQDGQFKIGKTSSEEFHAMCTDDHNSGATSENSSVEVSSNNVEIPNFLDLLSGLILQ